MTHWEQLKLRWKCWQLNICPKHAEKKEYINCYWSCHACRMEHYFLEVMKKKDRERQQRAMIQFLETHKEEL